MLVKISNHINSFTINNFESIELAKECFPNHEVVACNDVIDYASYSKYVQSSISKISTKWIKRSQFIDELEKHYSIIAKSIEFENDEYTNKEGTMYIYLKDNTLLSYNWYEDDFGDFSIGDFKDEDIWF